MNKALDQLRETISPISGTEVLLRDAIKEAAAVEDLDFRSEPGKPPPSEQLAALRDLIRKELVAFHDRLGVAPYAEGDFSATPGRRLWRVDIPVTLFPKRDWGFSRVECVVRFSPENEAGFFRVVGLMPKERDRVLGSTEYGLDATLQIRVSKEEGVLPSGLEALAQSSAVKVEDAGAKVYGSTKWHFARDHYRACVQAEIVGGTGARWRLDDPEDQRAVAAESHKLAVILETAEGIGPVHAAGYLTAQSSMRWLTATLGSIWERFTEAIRAVFTRGVPLEAFGEWKDLLKTG
jgi:hypothetical protein